MNPTGPRTEEGKNRSKLNALKHGLTGQTLMLSEDERQAYETHCQGYRNLYKPVGAPEEALVRMIADDYYRALRGRAIEINHLCNPESTSAPNADKVLANIVLYLTRIERSIRNNTKALQEMQAARKHSEQQPKEQAPAKAAQAPAPSPEFVFSPREFTPLNEFVFSTPDPAPTGRPFNPTQIRKKAA